MIRRTALLLQIALAVGPMSGELCLPSQAERIQCVAGTDCVVQPCEHQPASNGQVTPLTVQGWGTDPTMCFGPKQGAGMQLCKRQLFDLVSGKYVSIPQQWCTSECVTP